MKNHFLLTLLFVLIAQVASAQVSFGEPQRFNDDWLFLLSDDPAMARPAYDDTSFRRLNLPHDWSIEGQLSPDLASCTGYLPGGVAWYRKHFVIYDDAPLHYIYFEGVYNRSEVYLNGHLLGKRPNGYASFLYAMCWRLGWTTASMPTPVGTQVQASTVMYGWSPLARHT